MARIRTVKPELFRHTRLFEAERQSQLPLRLCFIGLFCIADREGRFRWEPRELKLDIAPYDDALDFSRVLDELSRGGFVERYTVEGRDYGRIPSWKRHQVIGAKEAASRIPAPAREFAGTPMMEREREGEGKKEREEKREVKGEQEAERKRGQGEADCAKPSPGSPHAEKVILPIPFIKLITDEDEAYSVYPSMVAEWKREYRAVDVEQELRHMSGWLMARPPSRRKPMRLMRSFVEHWLSDRQNRGGRGKYDPPELAA